MPNFSVRLAVSLVLLLWSCVGLAQDGKAKPCSDERAAGFDFWVGEWQLSWPDGQLGASAEKPGRGRNIIRKIMNGCTVEENFSVQDSSFIGRSWSVFDAAQGVWRQTWVDNSGGYLLFTGGPADGNMELRTAAREQDGKTLISRMVFTNITAYGFDWNWQRSIDGGATWADLWNIHYQRKK